MDPDTNRPIYIGEGLIPQVEAFASKFIYNNKPTLQLFNHIMNTMSEKAQKDTGNHFVIISNAKFWQDINLVLGEYLANFRTDGTYMYSKEAKNGNGSYVKVGATYNSYEYSGNYVTIIPDRSLSREYGNEKGYGLCIDLTADKTSGVPAVAKMSLLGKDFIKSTIAGVGGLDGKSSGEVASNVAGSKMVMMGYQGVACFTPFRSFIVREA